MLIDLNKKEIKIRVIKTKEIYNLRNISFVHRVIETDAWDECGFQRRYFKFEEVELVKSSQ